MKVLVRKEILDVLDKINQLREKIFAYQDLLEVDLTRQHLNHI